MRVLLRYWRANLVFLFIVLVFGGFAFQYYSGESKDAQRRARARFEQTSEARHARLLLRMQNRRQLLQALGSLFTASDTVEDSEFQDFGKALVGNRLRAVCWNSTDRAQSFAVAGAATGGEDLCREFDLTEPSRVFGEDPQVMLSSYAPSRSGTQRGYASVIFAVRDISLGDRERDLEEFLTIVDRSQNLAQTFQLGQSGATQIAHKDAAEIDDARYFEVASFGSFGFVYRTEFREAEAVAIPRAFLLALLALGFVAAVYVRSLLIIRERIAHEVVLRTEELSQFAYRTSHDLRAPLVTISGLCKASQEDLSDGDYSEVATNLERIDKHSTRLNELVTDILALTKADVGVEAPTAIDLQTICAEISEQLDQTFPEHGVLLTHKIDSPRVLLPRGRLVQILSNLVSNGLKYANHERVEPFVHTEIAHRGNALRVVVSDNGLGIPKERIDSVFNMFERFHPQSGQTGSGLGMAIVKRHVDRLGGIVEIESDERGTRVTLELRAEAVKT